MNPDIPRDQWEILHELSWQIVDASGSNHRKAEREAYRRLARFVREQARQRRSHPFIIEALADFTDDDRKAIQLYRRALRLARRRGFPRQTILLELARRHFAIKGRRRLARRYLRAALEEAFRRRDRDTVKGGVELLEENGRGAAA